MIFHQNDNSIGDYIYNSKIYDDCEWGYHFHKSFEIVYVMEGELEVQINDGKALLKKNNFALVMPNDIHCYHTENYSKVWIGVFSENFIPDFAKYIHGKTAKDISFKCDKIELAFLEAVLIREEVPEPYLLKAAIYIVINRFIKEIPITEKKKYDKSLAHLTIEYIENNFDRDLTLKEISMNLGYDYYYFSKYFNSTFNINFKTFLNQYRFENAKKLLHTSDKDIMTIAMESGFGSVRNFNRIYKQITGNVPKNDRKNEI